MADLFFLRVQNSVDLSRGDSGLARDRIEMDLDLFGQLKGSLALPFGPCPARTCCARVDGQRAPPDQRNKTTQRVTL